MTRSLKFGIVIAILFFAGFVGYTIYSQQNKDNQFIREVDPQLSEDDRKIYDDRLAQYQDMFNSAQDDDTKFTALIQQGYQLNGLGKLAEAKAKFEQAAEVKEDYRAYVALSEVEIRMTDYDSARESIKKAVSLNKISADVWRKYILLEAEQFQASNEALNGLYIDALRDTGNSVDIITVYAQFLEKSGNLQAAKEYWQKAMEANPSGGTLYQQEIQRLDQLMAEQGN